MDIKQKAEAWFHSTTGLDCYFESTDKEALMELAQDGNIYAICALLLGMNIKEHSWDEIFVDEETGEKVTIKRLEEVDGTTFSPDENEQSQLLQLADGMKAQLDTKTLGTVGTYIRAANINADSFWFELVQRGQEDVASRIDSPTLLTKLCEEGNKYAADELHLKYRYGDEKNGIFINRKRAKEYYDLAGDAVWDKWEDDEDPGEEFPEEYVYELKGSTDSLDAVKKMLEELCQKFGTPDNEFGMFVPQQILMKVLVGSTSKFYHGNILQLEQPSSDCLLLKTEADNGEPLLYALRHHFTDLEINLKK